MGMVLSCSRDALPGAAAAFVVVDFELRVSAVSEAGEKFFGGEDGVVGTPMLELVTSPLGDDQLIRNDRPRNAAPRRSRRDAAAPALRRGEHDGRPDRNLRTPPRGPGDGRAQ